jgi:hypothetical protein
MPDPKLLAEALVLLLAQALPSLLSAGEKAAGKAVEEVGKQAGAAVSGKIQEIWGRLRGKVEEKSAAKEAVAEVARDSGDADALGSLRMQLRKILEADPDLAALLAPLADAARTEINVTQVQAGNQGVAVGRDVHGNVIIINAAAGPVSAEEVLRLLGRERVPEELKRATDRYLRYLYDRYLYLNFRGLGISARIPLKLPLLEMYIPLHAQVAMPEGEAWERHRVAGRNLTAAEQEALGRGQSARQSVLDLLRKHDGLILLGDPGAGKTTFLKFLALTLATGQGEVVGLGDRLPVLVPLAPYAEALAKGDLPLLEFFARYFRERNVDLPMEEILKPALEKGKVFLLLDGLDEVRNPAHRHLLVERVRDFYSFHKDAGNKFILTSRIVGYREVRPEAPGLAEATLVDLEDQEIEGFIKRWTAALERAASGATGVAEFDAAREREELLSAVHGNLGVRALATNPLLLTILAVMKRQGVSLPERRVALYQACVETLLRHWNLARSLSGRSVAELDEVEILKVLAPLALWMHETSPGIGLVGEWELCHKLEDLCRERGHADAEGAARQFLEDVHKGTALLVDRGGRRYGFLHLTFQEYLAGMALAKLAEQEVGPLVDELAVHVNDAAWREVLLLAIGYLGIVQKRDGAAGAVLEELIRRAPGSPGEAVILAGRAVADMRAGGVTPRAGKKSLRSFSSRCGRNG